MIDVFDSSVDALENYTRILSFIHSFIHSLIHRGHSRRASTRRERRREDRSFSLVLSLSLSVVHRHIVTSRLVIVRPSAPPIDRARGAYLEVTTIRAGGRDVGKGVSTRVRSIGSTAHLNNLRVDGEHVSRQTRSDDDADDDDERTIDRTIESRAPSPSLDALARSRITDGVESSRVVIGQ